MGRRAARAAPRPSGRGRGPLGHPRPRHPPPRGRRPGAARDETLRATRHHGRALWTRRPGHHARGRVEAGPAPMAGPRVMLAGGAHGGHPVRGWDGRPGTGAGDAGLGRGRPPAGRGVRPQRVVVPAPGLDRDLRLAAGCSRVRRPAARRGARNWSARRGRSPRGCRARWRRRERARRRSAPSPRGRRTRGRRRTGCARTRRAPASARPGPRASRPSRAEPATGADRRRLGRELVHDAQHPERPPFVDEVVGPDMVGPLGPQANA